MPFTNLYGRLQFLGGILGQFGPDLLLSLASAFRYGYLPEPAASFRLTYATDTVAHLATALCPRRDAFQEHMNSLNIATDVHYPVLDCDQPGRVDLPKRIGPLVISSSGVKVALSCFPFMSEDEIVRVLAGLKSWGKK